MKAYAFNRTTGELIGECLAQVDPINGGAMAPRDATLTPPPDPVAGKVRRWNGRAWYLTDEPQPEPPPPPPPLTADDFVRAVQGELDRVARARGYDSILSAATYAGDPDPVFAAEAAALIAWRSACWRYCYQQLEAVQGATREAPASVASFVAELPAAPW